MINTSKSGVVLALFLFILGAALTGTPGEGPPPNVYLVQSCVDQVDNDGDSLGGSFPVQLQDLGDNECLFMPWDFGNGEYDGQGTNDPPQPDVQAYIGVWTSSYSHYPTQWEGIKALYDQYGLTVQDACNDGRSQNILQQYRDVYGLSDSFTGVSYHQSQCGLSY